MYARKQYMEDSQEDGFKAHRKYYREIADVSGLIPNKELVQRCKNSADRYYNDLPISLFSHIGYPVKERMKTALELRGDFLSEATIICVYKEAVRAAIEKERRNDVERAEAVRTFAVTTKEWALGRAIIAEIDRKEESEK